MKGLSVGPAAEPLPPAAASAAATAAAAAACVEDASVLRAANVRRGTKLRRRLVIDALRRLRLRTMLDPLLLPEGELASTLAVLGMGCPAAAAAAALSRASQRSAVLQWA
jgi:hypothetical protein